MPNLKRWIEAQLKRGYSNKQIKKALLKKGYSLKAVAEVDKISAAKAPQTKTIQISALLAVIIAVLVVAVVFKFRNLNFPEEPASALPEEPVSADELCKDFPKIQNEISCIEAVKLAAGKYAGNVKSITGDEASIAFDMSPDIAGMPQNITVMKRGVWLLEINLKKPIKGGPHGQIKDVLIAVDRIDGRVQMLFGG